MAFVQPAPDRIADGLLLSSCHTERRPLQELRSHGITHVLQVGAELQRSHAEDELCYMQLPVVDKPYAPIAGHFQETHEFIKNAIARGGAVLVHCQAGISRSSTIVVAHLMKATPGLSVADALDVVRAARWGVLPNPGFLCQLLEYEQCGCELGSDWPGWGFERWLQHPRAEEAISLHQKLLSFVPPAWNEECQAAAAPAWPSAQPGGEGSSAAAAGEALWSTSDSPFAFLAAAAAAAEAEQGDGPDDTSPDSGGASSDGAVLPPVAAVTVG